MAKSLDNQTGNKEFQFLESDIKGSIMGHRGSQMITTTRHKDITLAREAEQSMVPRNPYDTRKICGGSSSGFVAVVSSGLCPVALGVDGGEKAKMQADNQLPPTMDCPSCGPDMPGAMYIPSSGSTPLLYFTKPSILLRRPPRSSAAPLLRLYPIDGSPFLPPVLRLPPVLCQFLQSVVAAQNPPVFRSIIYILWSSFRVEIQLPPTATFEERDADIIDSMNRRFLSKAVLSSTPLDPKCVVIAIYCTHDIYKENMELKLALCSLRDKNLEGNNE
ncbi:hypothetical protein LguiA_013173 [Lonicera macranthoides]